MDLKESVQELHNNETFKHILATLLAIGNFLNGKKVCEEEFSSCLLVNDLSPGQTIATSQGNTSQHCWPSICKLRLNVSNISTPGEVL